MARKMPDELIEEIEGALRNYPLDCKYVRDWRSLALSANYRDEAERESRSPIGVSDPTYYSAERLCLPHFVRTELHTRAISLTYRELDSDMQDVILWHYLRGLPADLVAGRMGLTMTEFGRMKNLIIEAVAYQLGLLCPAMAWWK